MSGCRGQIEVMHYLAEEAKLQPSMRVLFLTPCHATPWFSHVHANISMDFLDCSPPGKHLLAALLTKSRKCCTSNIIHLDVQLFAHIQDAAKNAHGLQCKLCCQMEACCVFRPSATTSCALHGRNVWTGTSVCAIHAGWAADTKCLNTPACSMQSPKVAGKHNSTVPHEDDAFRQDPLLFLQSRWGTADKNSIPTHVVMFQDLVPALSRYIAEQNYALEKTIFNCHVQVDAGDRIWVWKQSMH